MNDAIEKAREAAAAFEWMQARNIWPGDAGFESAVIDVFLASLQASGHVIVPVEPTEAMIEKAHTMAVTVYAHRNLSAAFQRDLYQTMIEAANPPTPPPPAEGK